MCSILGIVENEDIIRTCKKETDQVIEEGFAIFAVHFFPPISFLPWTSNPYNDTFLFEPILVQDNMRHRCHYSNNLHIMNKN